MKHVDGLRVYLADQDGDRLPEYANKLIDAHKDFGCLWGSRTIRETPGKTFSVCVAVDKGFKIYTAKGIRVVVVGGYGNAGSDFAQEWWIDVDRKPQDSMSSISCLKLWKDGVSEWRGEKLTLPWPDLSYTVAESDWIQDGNYVANVGCIAVFIGRGTLNDKPAPSPKGLCEPPESVRNVKTSGPRPIRGEWFDELNSENGEQYVFEFRNMCVSEYNTNLVEAPEDFGYELEEDSSDDEAFTEMLRNRYGSTSDSDHEPSDSDPGSSEHSERFDLSELSDCSDASAESEVSLEPMSHNEANKGWQPSVTKRPNKTVSAKAVTQHANPKKRSIPRSPPDHETLSDSAGWKRQKQDDTSFPQISKQSESRRRCCEDRDDEEPLPLYQTPTINSQSPLHRFGTSRSSYRPILPKPNRDSHQIHAHCLPQTQPFSGPDTITKPTQIHAMAGMTSTQSRPAEVSSSALPSPPRTQPQAPAAVPQATELRQGTNQLRATQIGRDIRKKVERWEQLKLARELQENGKLPVETKWDKKMARLELLLKEELEEQGVVLPED